MPGFVLTTRLRCIFNEGPAKTTVVTFFERASAPFTVTKPSYQYPARGKRDRRKVVKKRKKERQKERESEKKKERKKKRKKKKVRTKDGWKKRKERKKERKEDREVKKGKKEKN